MADPIDVLRRPEVICRLLSLLFSIIVFGCISDKGKVTVDDSGDKYCVYDGDDGACNYGVAIGVIAFIACLIFLATDFFMDSISNVEAKKYILLSDLLFSGVWTFLWFVGFCYLCDKWRKQSDKDQFPSHAKSNAEGAIAFIFFSIISWALQTFFAFRNVNGGASNFEFGGHSRQPYESSPYSSFPDQQQNDDAYQAKPFQQSGQTDQSGEYRPPTY